MCTATSIVWENIRSRVLATKSTLPRLKLLRNRIRILQFYGVAAGCRRHRTMCGYHNKKHVSKEKGNESEARTCGHTAQSYSSPSQECWLKHIPFVLKWLFIPLKIVALHLQSKSQQLKQNNNNNKKNPQPWRPLAHASVSFYPQNWASPLLPPSGLRAGSWVGGWEGVGGADPRTGRLTWADSRWASLKAVTGFLRLLDLKVLQTGGGRNQNTCWNSKRDGEFKTPPFVSKVQVMWVAA